MPEIHKMEKEGQTIYPATVTTAIIDPDTRVKLQDNIDCWNISKIWPEESVSNLDTAVPVIASKLPAKLQIPGVKVEFKNTAGRNECWEFIGGTGIAFTDLAGWREIGGNAISELLNSVFPLTTTLTASPSLIEVGIATQVTLGWNTKRNGTDITGSTTYTLDGETVTGTTSKIINLTPSQYEQVTKKLTSIYRGDVKESSVTITAIQKSYYGPVAANAEINPGTVGALTSVLRGSKGSTISGIVLSNQRFVYAYPAVLGDLTSIKDGNGFEYLTGGGLVKTTITLNSVNYNVYYMPTPATVTDFKYTFA